MIGRPSRKVGMTYRKAKNGREAIPEGQEWSEGHSGGLEVVYMQSRWTGIGRKAITVSRHACRLCPLCLY